MNLKPENNKLFQSFKKNYHLYFLIIPFIVLTLDLLGFKIPTDAYFYTFSTIAQTLAALIAFIGMFVIFKLDKLKTETKISVKEIEYIHDTYLMSNKITYEKSTEYAKLCNIEYINLNQLIDNISEILLKIKTFNQDTVPHELRPTISKLNNHISSIESNKKLDGRLRKKYDTSLTFGFVAITISIIFLSLGWIYHPVINFNIPSIKMYILSFTIYAAAVSIFGLMLVLEESLDNVDDGNFYF